MRSFVRRFSSPAVGSAAKCAGIIVKIFDNHISFFEFSNLDASKINLKGHETTCAMLVLAESRRMLRRRLVPPNLEPLLATDQ